MRFKLRLIKPGDLLKWWARQPEELDIRGTTSTIWFLLGAFEIIKDWSLGSLALIQHMV